ncbi:monovalent cation/H+ antiporter subunit D [Thermaurantiacus sp.]
MSHLVALPFLLPFAAAALLLLPKDPAGPLARGLSLATLILGLVASLRLLGETGAGAIPVYRLGDWPAPYGIVLVGDRLAALLLFTLYGLAIPALLAAIRGEDRRGRHFHPLFQLQVAGIAGAFLTGDLFNLFVCFEILLIASYALLAHGGGHAAVRAGLPYVALNLVGSALFLVALAILYGTLGTLNLADMGARLPSVPATDAGLLKAGFVLLAVVFLLKAAVFPLGFWLPQVYPAAGTPALMLFAILTKVGVVSLLRVAALLLDGPEALAGLFRPWLPAAALLTLVAGTVQVLAARRLSGLVAGLVLVSSGTLVFAAADQRITATAALLAYLPHSVWATAGLFLVAGAIRGQRADLGDRLVRGPHLSDRLLTGIAFAVLAIAVVGLPPLSGFPLKLMLLDGAGADGWRLSWWFVLLASGLLATLALARAGSTLFWETLAEPAPQRPAVSLKLPMGLMLTFGLLLLVAVAPLARFALAAASDLHAPFAYRHAVLGPGPEIAREPRP